VQLSIDNKFKSQMSSSSQAQHLDEGVPMRPRGDSAGSADSRVSGTSAFARYIQEEVKDTSAITCKLLDMSKPDDFLLEITLTVTGERPGKSTWTVRRSRDDVTMFYERVMMTGPGNKFPIPPWGAPTKPSLPFFTSKHSKKKIRAPPRVASMKNLVSHVSSWLAPGSRSHGRRGHQTETMQEFMNEALYYWQRKWRGGSKSDEQGLALTFENFLCNSTQYGVQYSQEVLVPVSFRAALDAMSMGDSTTNAQVEAASRSSTRTLSLLALDPKRSSASSSHAKAYLTMVEHNRMHGSIENLRYNVFMYSWARYVSTPHPTARVPAVTAEDRLVFFAASKNAKEQSIWREDKSRTIAGSFVEQLVNVYSTPPTPHSAGHYAEVWTSFTDTILYRAECLLQYRIWDLQRQAAPTAPAAAAARGGTSMNQGRKAMSSAATQEVSLVA